MFPCAFSVGGKWGKRKHVFICFQGKGEMGKMVEKSEVASDHGEILSLAP